eukprot:GHVO01018893.1.p1 GENE.GHVO01018893.1~~GHVO01018893.1.p1  ORF type:complete len:155 (-),score=4.96 GHVO01018893.1:375-839(-)
MSQANPTDNEVTLYAESYVLYGCQSTAWRNAFPRAKCSSNNVHTKASLLHKNAKVLHRIEEIRAALKKQSEEEFKITTSDLKKMLVMAAQGGLKKKHDSFLYNIPGAVSAIAEINRMDGNHSPKEIRSKSVVTEIPADMSPEDAAKAYQDMMGS